MDDTYEVIEEQKQEVHAVVVEKPNPTPTINKTDNVLTRKTKEKKK